jgi:hypothetical protein
MKTGRPGGFRELRLSRFGRPGEFRDLRRSRESSGLMRLSRERKHMAKTPSKAWQSLLSQVTPEARHILTGNAVAVNDESPQDQEFNQLVSKLPAYAQHVMRPVKSKTAAQSTNESRRPRYNVLVYEDGEWHKHFTFDTPVEVAEKLRSLEGVDCTVVVIYGVACPFSQRPNRILMLPDDTAIQVTPAVAMVDAVNTSFVWQEDGYMGETRPVIEPVGVAASGGPDDVADAAILAAPPAAGLPDISDADDTSGAPEERD